MANIIEQFIAYAGDFERTLADDDWGRLRQYFTEDAIYDVKSDAFGGRMSGPTAIFAGMKKSLDGLDRRFTKRDIEVTEPPQVTGDEMTVGWKVLYEISGHPPFVMRGRSKVRYAGTKIAHLEDTFENDTEKDLATWRRQTGIEVDPSYT